MKMVRRFYFFTLCLLVLALSLSGCAKKVVKIPSIEALSSKNPMVNLLEAFSNFESIEAKASIRVETVRMGEEIKFLFNGFILFERPDQLRILGYHPLGMGLFDAFYRKGEFFLLIPLQKRIYTGEISDFEDQIEKAGIRISTEKAEGSEMPNRILIEAVKKETRIELKLKDIIVNSSLPEGSFEWVVPEGIEVSPLTKLLKGKHSR